MTGKTFIDYINSLKINKAIYLMHDQSMSITDVCFSVGYNNAPYFNKVFKKETGLSPRQYRNMSKKSK
jgi:two-component system response regulator YesN